MWRRIDRLREGKASRAGAGICEGVYYCLLKCVDVPRVPRYQVLNAECLYGACKNLCYVVEVVAGEEVKTNAAVVISCFSGTQQQSSEECQQQPTSGCSLVITISLWFLRAPSVMVGGMSVII